ncbi:MAG TPA: 5-oxoprolinase subunit PxpA, partial [Acidimicrobiales bacterium]|nr:5-oxoprolinase subunit PxpA [Acidimicrobiales bacterium]
MTVDLNADLAEGDTLSAADRLVLDSVTSASLACGFHAGSPSVMRATAAACVERGVVIGAHVSYRDREGFGRRVLGTPADVLVGDILDQWAALVAEVDAVGGSVSYVKPHGALYNQMGIDPAVADAVVEAVARLHGTELVAPAGSVVADSARRAGIRVIPEGFPDRGYLPDGRLVPRSVDGAVVEDPVDVARRAVSLVRRHG